jgi:hypothetical protein
MRAQLVSKDRRHPFVKPWLPPFLINSSRAMGVYEVQCTALDCPGKGFLSHSTKTTLSSIFLPICRRRSYGIPFSMVLTQHVMLCREGLFLLPYDELAVAQGPKIYQKNEL